MWQRLLGKERFLLSGLTVASFAFRFWQLGEPAELVFDEVYYPKWAQDYLQGESFFDVHPPLGKLLMAVGIWLFKSNPEANIGALGWRFMGALIGALIVPLTYLIARKLFAAANAPRIAFLAALFVLIDGLLLVQTRMGLLDSFLITFTLAAVASFLMASSAPTQRGQTNWLLATGAFLGLALATKWTALAPFGVLLAFWLAKQKMEDRRWKIGATLFAFGLIPATIYVASFLFNERTMDFVPYLIDWHLQTWNFHVTLEASHPYASRGWSWLVLARPVWYYFQETDGVVRGIIALGNPILWWASVPALLASIWVVLKRRATQLLLPLLLFLAFYLPWTIIGRVQFQYYLAAGVPFLFILLAYWADRWLSSPKRRLIAVTLTLLAILTFFYWLPLLTGQPISSAFYRSHLWFNSWI